MVNESEDDIDAGALTEDHVAKAFAKKYGRQLSYCHDHGAWFEFDGAIWRRQTTPRTFHYVREMCRKLSVRANNANLHKLKFMQAIETLAQKDASLARDAAHWDTDPLLIGTPSGTVDLRTGRLRESAPADAITKSVCVAPAPHEDCPTWHTFIEQATAGDEGLSRFLQQVAGYCLTGLTIEQALFFLYGTGGNGKGTFVGAVQGIMGDYAQTAGMELLEKQKFTGHPTDLAALAGSRAVIAAETEEGGDWNEKRIKQMTGGDRIKARFMRQNEFEYTPQFKLLISGNHEPALRSVDEAMRRRFNIIPFTVRPPHKDLELSDKLRAEWPGILRWMINGCLDWQEHKLVRPDVVLRATQEYFDDQNTMQQWIDQMCVVEINNIHFAERSSAMFASWSKYAVASGLTAGSSKTFKPAMERLGMTSRRTSSGIVWDGIVLKTSLNRGDDER